MSKFSNYFCVARGGQVAAGTMRAGALVVDAFVVSVPLIDGSQQQMLLAALLVFVSR